MWYSEVGIYLGELRNGYIGFISNPDLEDQRVNFYLIVYFPSEVSKDQQHQKIELIKNKIKKRSQGIKSLNDLEEFLNDVIREGDFPTICSIACAYLTNEGIVYLKTIGEGIIYLYRQGRLVKLINGEKSASGYVKEGDYLILTIVNFIKRFEEKKIKKIIDNNSPNKIVELFNQEVLFERDNLDLGAIFLKFFLFKDNGENSDFSINKEEDRDIQKNNNRLFLLSNLIQKCIHLSKEKRLTFFVTIIICFILFWSVLSGYQRRQIEINNKKIKQVRELINQKLNQAEDVAFLNIEQARALVEEAKGDLNELKKELKISKNKKNTQIEDLENLIREKENKIVKKEEKNYTEFYDLAVDDQNAKINKVTLDEENLLILDNDNGVVYSLSLTKKSLNKIRNKEIKNSLFITGYEGKIFFYVKDKGIYQIDEQEKIKKVLEKDPDWGEIGAIFSYNKNLYLVDKKKNQIYKYLPTEVGYGSKNNYLKSPSDSLFDINSVAVDGSIYLGFSKYILKFTLGEKDEFFNDFPNENLKIKKIYTDKNLERVFVWDQNEGKVYLMTKNGRYEKQIESLIFKQAKDFVVHQDKVYLILGKKIYQVTW